MTGATPAAGDAPDVKPITVWLDVVSPYSWLAFQRLPETLAGHSVTLRLRPVLFAGLLKRWGQLGPAEIAPKRDWTFRQVAWLAQRDGLELQMPAAHPYNPLSLLRLLVAHGIACGMPGDANRHAWTTVFRHAWTAGQAADDPARLPALCEALRPGEGEALWQAAQGDDAKALLRANTEEAADAGVFGVPTVVLQGRSFWGYDGLEMLAAWLRGDAALRDEAWTAPDRVAVGVRRERG